jgi:hypothetical protein
MDGGVCKQPTPDQKSGVVKEDNFDVSKIRKQPRASFLSKVKEFEQATHIPSTNTCKQAP